VVDALVFMPKPIPRSLWVGDDLISFPKLTLYAIMNLLIERDTQKGSGELTSGLNDLGVYASNGGGGVPNGSTRRAPSGTELRGSTPPSLANPG
jgi:hypothetical protein